ncbi:MAG: GDP-mannose 4,6-dehydratase, partial [Winogradskyella sp.]|nr:GDP-mannose 4,6-dehydratase [Winogradskyella sp.]
MKILVTGAAGFIGFFTSKVLLEKGHEVVGLDNINDYYDVNLKFSRLEELGISRSDAEKFNKLTKNSNDKFSFVRMNLEDREALPKLFEQEKFDVVCNLAAQAGVRYSLENPETYIDSNLVGFLNILECCRHNKIKHLVYASSSSVYGLNEKIPFS